jgi:hypothetical protein
MPTLLKPCKLTYENLNNKNSPVVKRYGNRRSLCKIVLEEKLGRPLEFGHICCHHCDVPNCIEPEHLYEGTYSQNMKDQWRRRRRKPLGFYK